MMKSLRRTDAVAKCKGMMQIIARLILAFAFVASTAHTPAIAHEEPANHHGNISTMPDHDSIAGYHGEAPSSHEGAGDSVHHHHCPSVLDSRATDIAFGETSGKTLLLLQRAAVLTSFSQAPPTEPPST